MTIEVEHYDYAFDLESRQASTALTISVVEEGNCFALPMRAVNLDADVRIDDEPVTADFTDELLSVCGAGWRAGEEFVLTAAMEVALDTWENSQVGYSVSTDLEGNPFSYLVSWVGGCDRFGPCDAAPDRFPQYRFTVNHPSGTQVLCSGDVTPGDTQTTCEFNHEGGPTYSTFALVASPSWVPVELGDWNGVRAVLYDTPTADIGTDLDVATHAAFFAWMEERFGPYPYGDEIRFAVGPTYWSGFEHPGNIVLYHGLNRIFNSAYDDPLTHTTNHEIAHQWAGDQTTLAGTYDFVWKEAMAEYLSFVFEDESTGWSSSAPAWKLFSQSSAYYPVPGEQPPLLDYYGDVYGPGPMVLFRQIEALFDRESVITALQSLLGTERAISVADVKAALEQNTGADLTNYFDVWVYGEGIPERPAFSVTTTDVGGGMVNVTVTQETPTDRLFGCAFAVELQGAGGESHEVWIDLGVDGMQSTTVTTAPGFEVVGHEFDVHSHTLAVDADKTTPAVAGPTNPWLAPERPTPYRR